MRIARFLFCTTLLGLSSATYAQQNNVLNYSATAANGFNTGMAGSTPNVMPVATAFHVDDESEAEPVKKKKAFKPGYNLVTFSPIVITGESMGFGVGYEYVLDKKGVLAISLPVAVGMNFFSNNRYYNGYPTPNGYSGNTISCFFTPGLKIYPTSNRGRVKYAVAPSFFLGKNFGNDGYYPYGSYTSTYYGNGLIMGGMVINSLNISPTNNFYIGAELGLGVTHIRSTYGGYSTDLLESVNQLSLKVGYRF